MGPLASRKFTLSSRQTALQGRGRNQQQKAQRRPKKRKKLRKILRTLMRSLLLPQLSMEQLFKTEMQRRTTQTRRMKKRKASQ